RRKTTGPRKEPTPGIPIPETATAPAPSPELSQSRRRRNQDQDDDIVVNVALSPPLIPEGEYTARSVRVKKIDAFKRSMLRLELEIYGGPSDGTTVFWFASLPKEGKRPKGYSSKFGRAWELAMGRRPERGKRVSAKALVGKIYRVRVV